MTLIVKIITENKKVGKIPTFYFFYKYLSNAFFNLS